MIDRDELQSDAPRVVILNNEVMPYRVPLFHALHRRQQIRPYVLYGAKRSWERSWSLTSARLDYPHKVLRGFTARLPKPRFGEWRTIVINPTLLLDLVRLAPDAVIAYEYSVPALTALFYCATRGCPYLTWSEMTAHSARGLSRGQRRTRRLIVPRASAFLGTSRAACDHFVELGASRDRIVLAPQTVDTDLFHVPRREEPRRLSVLYVGFLNDRKGVTHLVRAFRIVAERVPGATLKLVGTGERQATVERLCHELGVGARVELSGFVEPETLPDVYARADVFVLPSLEDTFGVVATEALAAGAPIVCSRFAGFSSHVTDGENAYIVDPTNHEALADRISRLLEDRELRDRFRDSGYALLEEFTPNRVAERFEHATWLALAQNRQ